MSKTVTWRVPKRRLFSTPLPPETRTYKPVSHKLLAKTVLDAIKLAGFKVGVEEYFSARDGLVATARYTIEDISDKDMVLEIGWQNSYDKTLSLKFAIGTRIFICSNGCVSGNFGAFSKKHMADVKEFSSTEITDAILNAHKVFESIVKEKEMMKTIPLTSEEQGEILGRLFFNHDLIGSTQINMIKTELKTPSLDYGAPGSLWELYQFVTYSMKEMHPRLWIDNHIDVHKFFLKILEEKDAIIVAVTKLEKTEVVDAVDSNQLNLLDVIEEVETSSGLEVPIEWKEENTENNNTD